MTAATPAATATDGERGASVTRPHVIQPSPHAIAAATAYRPPRRRAGTTPTSAATSSTTTASASATGDVGAGRNRHPAEVEPEGAVDDGPFSEPGAAGPEVGQPPDEHSENDDQTRDDDDAHPDPAHLGDEQPGRVEHHRRRSQPSGRPGPGRVRLGGKDLPDRVCREPEVDDRPHREGRDSRGNEGGVGGEAPARRLLDPGSEHSDTEKRADDAGDLTDHNRHLADPIVPGRTFDGRHAAPHDERECRSEGPNIPAG